MQEMGKFLVLIGVVLVVTGAVLWAGFGKGWLGRLPGDIQYSRGNFSFYLPLATCVVLSLILTVVLWLLRR